MNEARRRNPKKSLGQHFLTDIETARTVIRAGKINLATTVVEVGPGRGFLTRHLVQVARNVIAIEKDSALAAELPGTLRAANLTVIEGDFLNVELGMPNAEPAPRTTLVGNLPYNVAMPILARALDHGHLWQRMVLMFQLEVAQRICAQPGSKTYGIPTIMTALSHSASLVRRVPAGAFFPRPKVDSALVLFEPLAEPLLPPALRRPFLDFIGSAFRFRRKTAANALSRASGLHPSQKEFAAALESAGYAPDSRLEQLAPSALVALWAAENPAGE